MTKGETLAERNRIKATSDRNRQFSNYTVDLSTGCWIWNGGKDKDGYGKCKRHGKDYRAHRVFFEEFVRTLRGREQALHHCDNPPCVNPDHLFAGTHLDNEQNKDSKGRRPPPPSISHPELMPRGEKHVRSKLTEKAVSDIRSSIEGSRALAARYGVHPTSIQRVRSGKTWSHVHAAGFIAPPGWEGEAA